MATKSSKDEEKIGYRVLISPWITEEATRQGEFGKYVFKVFPGSDKREIKKAVQEAFGVTVTAVQTITIPRKRRLRGRTSGWKASISSRA